MHGSTNKTKDLLRDVKVWFGVGQQISKLPHDMEWPQEALQGKENGAHKEPKMPTKPLSCKHDYRDKILPYGYQTSAARNMLQRQMFPQHCLHEQRMHSASFARQR